MRETYPSPWFYGNWPIHSSHSMSPTGAQGPSPQWMVLDHWAHPNSVLHPHHWSNHFPSSNWMRNYYDISPHGSVNEIWERGHRWLRWGGKTWVRPEVDWNGSRSWWTNGNTHRRRRWAFECRHPLCSMWRNSPCCTSWKVLYERTVMT